MEKEAEKTMETRVTVYGPCRTHRLKNKSSLFVSLVRTGGRFLFFMFFPRCVSCFPGCGSSIFWGTR